MTAVTTQSPGSICTLCVDVKLFLMMDKDQVWQSRSLSMFSASHVEQEEAGEVSPACGMMNL